MIAFRTSDLHNMVVPIDDVDRRCGMEYRVRDQPNAIYFDLLECISFHALFYGCPTKRVCRERCPSKIFVFDLDKCHDGFSQYKRDVECDFHTNKTNFRNCNDIKKSIDKNECTGFYLPSESRKCVINRCYCVPLSKNPKQTKNNKYCITCVLNLVFQYCIPVENIEVPDFGTNYSSRAKLVYKAISNARAFSKVID